MQKLVRVLSVGTNREVNANRFARLLGARMSFDGGEWQ
jgi:hypothetical protein